VNTVSDKVVTHSLAYLSVQIWLVGDVPWSPYQFIWYFTSTICRLHSAIHLYTSCRTFLHSSTYRTMSSSVTPLVLLQRPSINPEKSEL